MKSCNLHLFSVVLNSSSVTDEEDPREILEGNNTSVQTTTKQVESFGSSGIELADERENTENVKTTHKGGGIWSFIWFTYYSD